MPSILLLLIVLCIISYVYSINCDEHAVGGRNRCLTFEEKCEAWRDTKFFNEYFTPSEQILCMAMSNKHEQ